MEGPAVPAEDSAPTPTTPGEYYIDIYHTLRSLGADMRRMADKLDEHCSATARALEIHATRLAALELAQAEARGRSAVTGTIAGLVGGAVATTIATLILRAIS